MLYEGWKQVNLGTVTLLYGLIEAVGAVFTDFLSRILHLVLNVGHSVASLYNSLPYCHMKGPQLMLPFIAKMCGAMRFI